MTILKISKKEIWYLLGYIFYVFATSFLTNVHPSFSRGVKIIALLLMILQVIQQKYTVKKIMIYIFLMSVLLVMGYQNGSYTIMIMFLFIISYNCKDFFRLVKLDFVVRTTGFILTNCLCLTGVIEDVVLMRYTGDGTIERHSFGYVHPNTCFAMLVIIVIDYVIIVCKKKKKVPIGILALIVIAVIFYEEGTGSRSGFVILIIMSIVIFVEKKMKLVTNHKIIKNSLIYSPIICLFISWVAVQLYSKLEFLPNVLNVLFTNRLSSMYYYWNNYSVTLFGQTLLKVGTQQATALNTRAYVLDNLYLNLLLAYGIIFTVIYIVIYIKTNKSLARKGEIYYLIVCALFAIYGLVEGITLNIDYNFYFILSSVYAWDKGKMTKN